MTTPASDKQKIAFANHIRDVVRALLAPELGDEYARRCAHQIRADLSLDLKTNAEFPGLRRMQFLERAANGDGHAAVLPAAEDGGEGAL
jgi:hypothetical protein